MKRILLIKHKILIGFLLTIATVSHAGAPVWIFTPLTATSISVPTNGTATIQYQVTNQSAKSHSLVMTPITGITQMTTGPGICSNPFTLSSRGSSCTLSLQINGGQLTHSITDGPIVCEHGSTLQCYKPSPSNILNIDIGINEYTIGGTVSGLSGNVVLQNNGTNNETVSSDGGFAFSTAIAKGSPYAVTILTQPVGQTCVVANGSGTVGSSNVTNVNVSCSDNVTTLQASVTNLALSVTGLTEYGVSGTPSSGLPRIITIDNVGSSSATNVTYSPSPALPSGTSISPASCGTIAVSGTCVLTITPGSTPSAAAGVTSPIPITLSISGTNTNTLTPTVNILTYGSVYAGGYVYAVDDSLPNTDSIGGKVATLINQETSITWSSDGSGGTSLIAIYGISETSTTSSPNPNPGDSPQPVTGQTACNGNIDGACDSNNIYVYYQPPTTNPGINTSLYATGLCKATINGYDDWYLPAICEMGFDTFSNGSGCGNDGVGANPPPTLQNMQSNLVANGNIGALSGFYWSSTEYSGNPTNEVWAQHFASSSIQYSDIKLASLGVRCSRAF